MTCDVISTGSQGNAVVLDGKILIDCGVSLAKLRPYMKGLRLVLLTHIHGDHFNPRTVRALHRERPGLRWGCCEWMVGHLLQAGVDKRVIDVYKPGETLCYFRLFMVEPVLLMHDVPNCGWEIVLFKDGTSESTFYATDTSTLDGIKAPGYDLYLIEANYTDADLKARAVEKLDAGQFAYEIRAAKNHLSQEQAEEWIRQQSGPNSRYIFLHQHRGGDTGCRTES